MSSEIGWNMGEKELEDGLVLGAYWRTMIGVRIFIGA